MFTRLLLLTPAVVLALAAQPLITIQPTADKIPEGITIHTPSDPSFPSSVEKILPPAAVPLYQPLLPYSVLIRNETSTPVIGMVVTLQITDASGRTPKPEEGHFGNTPPRKDQILVAPGRDMLFTPDPTFTQLAPILSAFKEANLKERLDRLAARSLEPYLSARAITLGLDAVLFADGTVKGPDKANAFEAWSNALQIQRAFDSSVLALKDRGTEELSQYLAGVASTPQQRHSWARPDTSLLAQNAARLLGKRGPEVVFKMLEDDLSRTELTIHR